MADAANKHCRTRYGHLTFPALDRTIPPRVLGAVEENARKCILTAQVNSHNLNLLFHTIFPKTYRAPGIQSLPGDPPPKRIRQHAKDTMK